ncbi:MAG: hypothetical protein HYZ37_10585 [Candidatus Solibacter usitatus]|nr:hypothetical protein [Candidatus Solibacter usitatus]
MKTVLSCVLIALLTTHLPGVAVYAQDTKPPAKLTIVIIEGEGAINNIKQRVAREPIVEVRDENNKPLAGASVVFTLPGQGAGGTFTNGARVLTMTTNNSGRATMSGFRPNNLQGNFQVRITASHQGQVASATITQTNAVVGAAAGAGGAAGAAGAATGMSVAAKVLIVLALVGVTGGVTGGVVSTRGGGTSNGNSGIGQPPPVSRATGITPGPPTIGPPR